MRASVQVEALRCTRVLAVRVAAEHLTALWPVAIAELQRVLLAPLEARPALHTVGGRFWLVLQYLQYS